ncbi:MAG: UDP-2,3-diacylglucosamine diphosphatase LpxI, partial [Acidobacteriota bacterium]|nr:UDP-2,3-diacylglucosamine diphosphatase LpxI [Acidobacteriota bacterium]
MKYGLIAGNGKFPFLVVEGARKAGASLIVAAIKEETDQSIETIAEKVVWVGIGQLGKMISFFKSEGVEQVIMAGQVRHIQIFSGAFPDWRMAKMLYNLPRRNTDSLIGGIAAELAKDGIELIDSTYFIKDQLAAKGVLSKRNPDEIERGNIEYGLNVANEIARLDLGQTIVVRAKACVAIEAMEGTDAVIKRAGELAKGKLTVIKVAKPNQDMRFDVPVVGVPTIEMMIRAGASCLC